MKSDNYQKKIDILVDYFKSGEVNDSEFKLGMEVEHFVVKEDSLEAVSYYGINGIEGILKELLKNKWQGTYENKNLLALKGEYADISLEPGGQLELSLHPVKTIKEIDFLYKKFLKEISLILKKRELALLNLGYQPISKINNVPLLPKRRYDFMYRYFKNKGKYAHNMMKGTASIQLNLDYRNEEDFSKKMRVANFLSPFVYYFFDNSPFFEGKAVHDFSVRSSIWDNCDSSRCGFIDDVFKRKLSYSDYAEYILRLPSIIVMENDKLRYSGEELIQNVFELDFFTSEKLEHLLSMAFPEVRLKKYIELRSGDSLPYPYNIAYIAFLKALLYNQNNLDKLFEESLAFKENDIRTLKNEISQAKHDILIKNKSIDDYMLDLLSMASEGLKLEERDYISLLEDLIRNNRNPKTKTLEMFSDGYNLRDALSWCIFRGGN
ncbi:glutamate--cysteine ligase [Natronospora cellulosivora (SeqCode)]